MNTTQITTRRHVRFDLISFAFVAFAGLAGMAASNPAQAADAAKAGPRKVTVEYADLNLSNPQGVEQLYSRINAAAGQVCADPGSKSLGNWLQTRICTRQSIERAVAAVDLPALTALHAAKTGQPAPVQVATR
jgi:UrcA family protein